MVFFYFPPSLGDRRKLGLVQGGVAADQLVVQFVYVVG